MRGVINRRILVPFVTTFAIAAFFYLPGPNRGRTRPPNTNETFYQYIAFELDAPALCGKLSPAAILPGGFFIAQSYARSDCYAKLALHFDHPALCWKAPRLGSLAIFSEQTSRMSCWWQVLRDAPEPNISTYMPNPNELNAIFAAMGYRPDEIYHEGLTPPLLNMQDAFRQLDRQPDLVERIERVTANAASPAPSAELTPDDRATLFDLAAHVSGDPSWCMRIDADRLDSTASPNSHIPRLYKRDRCVLEIASNKRRPAFCALIPNRGDDRPGPLSYRSLCERQASLPPDKYHYGAEPPDAAEAQRTITILGYPLPRLHDVPAHEITSAYYYFIWGMARSDLAAARAARAKFLDHVAALPSYN